MYLLNDWHDSLRVIALVAALASLYLLWKRYYEHRNEWNTKTKDLWFTLLVWTIAAIILPIEGLFEDRPLEPRLVFYFAASVISVKGLYKKDEWGGDDR